MSDAPLTQADEREWVLGWPPSEAVRWAAAVVMNPNGPRLTGADEPLIVVAKSRLVEVERERDEARTADSRMCDILQGERDRAEERTTVAEFERKDAEEDRQREHVRAEGYREALEYIEDLPANYQRTGEGLATAAQIANVALRPSSGENP